MNKQIIREINNGSWKTTYDTLNIINKTNIYKIIKPILKMVKERYQPVILVLNISIQINGAQVLNN